MQYSMGAYTQMHWVPYLEKCDSKDIRIDATQYGGGRSDMLITVNKVKGAVDENRPALIFFHGGAFVFYDAKMTQVEACHHAVEFDCTVFGVDYGVAPEVKAPESGLNCYAAVRYIVDHATEFNLDPRRIAIGGESAGGAHTALCSYQLAMHNCSHLVKFAWMDIAAVSNHWFDRTAENCRDWVERDSVGGQVRENRRRGERSRWADADSGSAVNSLIHIQSGAHWSALSRARRSMTSRTTPMARPSRPSAGAAWSRSRMIRRSSLAACPTKLLDAARQHIYRRESFIAVVRPALLCLAMRCRVMQL